jgi:hypothetical protein
MYGDEEVVEVVQDGYGQEEVIEQPEFEQPEFVEEVPEQVEIVNDGYGQEEVIEQPEEVIVEDNQYGDQGDNLVEDIMDDL